MAIQVTKRSGKRANLDISKIKHQINKAEQGLTNISKSEMELDSQLQFRDGMSTKEITDSLISTAVEKIDIDTPDYTFLAARLALYDLYHDVRRVLKLKKGEDPYNHFDKYISNGINEGKLIPSLANGYNVKELGSYIKPERDMLFTYLGFKTLYDRYLVKDNNGRTIELPQQMFMAIAMFLAQNEENKQEKAKEFYDVISKFEVMLATPTLSNARTNRHQLSSCYIGSTPDNIEGIFDSYHEMALLSKYGGGIGWDWNQVRAQGAAIDGNVGASAGIVPPLKITNDLALYVDQLGTRKGAIAVYIEPDHADVLDFIDLKKNSGEERRRAHDLFPALWIGDDFMEAIKADADWHLYDPADRSKPVRTMKAKDLWKKVLTSYFESGSPFLCFKDNANRANPNGHVGHIRSSNLCTEIFQNTEPNYYHVKLEIDGGNRFITVNEDDDVPLINGVVKKGNKVTSLDTLEPKEVVNPEYFSSEEEMLEACRVYQVSKHQIPGKTAVCNLASINLSRINTKEDIERVTPVAIRMLDNVIDLNYYPLRKVKDTNLSSRAIGLGVMGEAQMLADSQIHYGSLEHLNKINGIMELISFSAINASSDLAKEKGAYEDFQGSNWSKGIMPHDHTPQAVMDMFPVTKDDRWAELRIKVMRDGMRNGYLMAIAPTSSISILVGTTQAIEPVYKRKWFEENLSGLIPVTAPNLNVNNYAYYQPSFEVDQMGIIKAAAIRQKWIDQGQSTNIFMSLEKASGKYLHELYMKAWELGLKSTYYLRSQSPEADKATETVDRSFECAGCQ
jgi:ribonucleoside-diphosphate reductase alpha chain